ncbi:MAG TPA: DUF2235 domain-containing protein [Candidatus Thermoplasmatota archaeon]|nr:DUF2235 domain-containing protein [Candidatus Thermoplasmatota archaeon]
MAKRRLVLFLDGTWKSADGEGRSTNVVKLMRAVAPKGKDGADQIVYYDSGIGSDGGWWERMLAGATGRGLDKNVKDAYLFLGNNWRPGDEVFLFGFSRGAFTARSLAGFIECCGLLDRHQLRHLRQAWDAYRKRRCKDENEDVARLQGQTVPVTCLGVWDTVGALGIPIRWFSPARWHKKRKYAFYNTDLGDGVKCALHAIAVDEKRGAFAPTLWQRHEDRPLKKGHVAEQVWFAGTHSDVGGGNEDAGLSDVTLEWMVERVDHHTDLAFLDEWRTLDPHWNVKGNPLGVLHESRSLGYLVSYPLPFQRIIAGKDSWTRRFFRSRNLPKENHLFVNEGIHARVLHRFGKEAPRQGLFGKPKPKWYRPKNVRAAKDEGADVVR